MTWCLAEAQAAALEETTPYGVELHCDGCGERWFARALAGEVEPSDKSCPCGGEVVEV